MAAERGEGPPPELVNRRSVHEGRVVRLSVDRVRFPDGSEGELELVRHAGASAVLPFLDPVSDPDPRVLLIHQYRYPAGGYLYEVPAGMPEAGEDPEACARRELVEEVGRRAGALRLLTRMYTTPGFTDEVIHLFTGHDLVEADGVRDRDEFLRVSAVRFSRALEMVRRGGIVDGKTVATLLYVAAFQAPGGTDRERPTTG